MKKKREASPLKHHKDLTAWLLAAGYNWEAANRIATRALLEQTLFPNEQEDADAAMLLIVGPTKFK